MDVLPDVLLVALLAVLLVALLAVQPVVLLDAPLDAPLVVLPVAVVGNC